MITDIGRGAGYLAQGLAMINQSGIRRYVIIPLMLNILLFAALISYGYSQFSPLVDWMMSFIPDWLSFLEGIIWLVIVVLSALVVFLTFTPIANIISAPFNAIMAEKIEEKLTGEDINSQVSLMTIIIDSIMSQIGKLAYIVFWSLILFIISLIPVVNLISPFLWLIFGSWMLSLEYLDYPMGNHDLPFKKQKLILQRRRGLALGFGGTVMLLTTIPVVNFFVIPVSVAGATIMWVKQLKASAIS